jgi:galactokinase/mevalonate kinase-like predicted kinase
VQQQVSKISPEITNTEYYFASVIEDQVKKMQKESTPETQKLIADTMIQLRNLDSDYKKMEQDLLDGGNSKLILSAMITNFQTRIDLLNEVLEQIEEIKNFKNYENENITA